jgi:DNA-binding transcriptional regulator YdaS (Cro superfamily)
VNTKYISPVSKAAQFLGGMKTLAEALDCSVQAIHKWGDFPPPKRCVQIEQLTFGQITRKQLRSDWHEIWPELKD